MILYDYQIEALEKMKNGCILCGSVGSGKSRTALAYYALKNYVDDIDIFKKELTISLDNVINEITQDLYIITTARKRDTYEWESDMVPFLLTTNENLNPFGNKIVVDSWNNIKKYANVTNAFFIFDEQRLVGNGVWVKSFLKIAKNNEWILLSATPGDTWSDYIPVFIANGYFRNRTEFITNHVVYSRITKFPKIDRYLNTGRLIRLRNNILVDMDFKRKTVQHHYDIYTNYDSGKYKQVCKSRFNPYTNKPIETASEFCQTLRHIVNLDDSRLVKVLEILEKHPRIIIFYNYNYELDALKNLGYPDEVEIAEWNGHKHQEIPEADSWVYLVQYTAGAEGWNCVKTDTIIFFSQNYSYKIMIQSSGRIDRLNTHYTDLYYYHLKSHSSIDIAISKALSQKKKFNEDKFAQF